MAGSINSVLDQTGHLTVETFRRVHNWESENHSIFILFLHAT
jgi:hypothetical protein